MIPAVLAAIAESPPLLRTVHDLAYLAGGPAHVLAVAVFLGANSLRSPPRLCSRTGLRRWKSRRSNRLRMPGAAACSWSVARMQLLR